MLITLIVLLMVPIKLILGFADSLMPEQKRIKRNTFKKLPAI
jgi:hypothetical protein